MTFDTSIGIKQVIRYEWMKHTVELLKSGLSKEDLRKELENYLADRKGNGKTGDRAEYTMSLAATVLMNIWVTPKPELVNFRDRLLKMTNHEKFAPVCHWAMLSSAYPFWFNISYTFGSLFRLQKQIKKSQIMNRIYENLGERNTIERCSRYVIRSFVAWDLIRDKEKAGYYEKGTVTAISDIDIAGILAETMLNAVPEERITVTSFLNCQAFFSFSFPSINGSQIVKANEHLCVEQFSVNDEYMSLKN
jgi:hypothetical protein